MIEKLISVAREIVLVVRRMREISDAVAESNEIIAQGFEKADERIRELEQRLREQEIRTARLEGIISTQMMAQAPYLFQQGDIDPLGPARQIDEDTPSGPTP